MSDDYTQIPDAESPEDIEFDDIQTHSKGAEEIAAENSFRDVPPGVHKFRVHSIGEVKRNQGHMVKVKTDGGHMVDASYHSNDVRLVLCLADDPSAQISDFFQILCSLDPDEGHAYYHGLPADKPTGKPGFPANKWFHFMNILAPDWKAGEPMPFRKYSDMLADETGEPRYFLAEIAPGSGQYHAKGKDGKPLYDDKGEKVMKDGRPQLKLFSYRLVAPGWTPEADPVNVALAAKGHAIPAAAPTQATTPAPSGHKANGHAPAAATATMAPPKKKIKPGDL